MKIIAKGKCGGFDSTVEVEQNGKTMTFLFNGKEDELSKQLLITSLKQRYNVGNDHPDVYEGVNIINVLERHFWFDEMPEIIAEGVKPLPYEKGMIY